MGKVKLGRPIEGRRVDLKMSVGCALLESGESPPQGLFNLLPGPPGLQRPGSVSSLTSKQRNQTVPLQGSELCFTRHLLGDGPLLASVWDIQQKEYRLSLSGHTRSS